MASNVDNVKVEISVVLGRSVIPMHQLLRMGRGAVIEQLAGEAELVLDQLHVQLVRLVHDLELP